MTQIYLPKKEPMRLACMLSGSGTNVRKIIERQLNLGTNSPFKVVAIFTDNKKSNGMNIAAETAIPFLCNDLKEYYAERNAERKDMNVRREYDAETKKFFSQHKVDAVALCGYLSIVTEEITDNYITVNIHPADLRVKDKNGKRLYAGMLDIPSVQAAILNSESTLRSTAHLVTSGLDEGPILMVSAPAKVEVSEEEKKDPILLKKASSRNMEKLKEKGDWVIYPELIEMIARGRFSIEGNTVFVDGTKHEDYCPSDEKEAVRHAMKEKRKSLPDIAEKSTSITKKLLALSEFQAAKIVMFYWALPDEVQTSEAIKEAISLGKKVLLPVTKNGNISVRGFTGFENLKSGDYGVLEPTNEDSADESIDIIFVPGLAFDKNGARIGFGLGCYDEFLKLTAGKKAGLCFEQQLFDRLPTESKDFPMDIIITEQRVIKVAKA